MTCHHYRQFNRDGIWKCRSCGAEVPKNSLSGEELVEAVRGAAVHVTDSSPPDLGEHAYRESFRTGTPEQEERKEAAACAVQRDMTRNGAKAREKQGVRHTHSIPRDIYYGAMRKYGKDVWKDQKFKKRFKAFKTTDQKD